MSTEPPRRPARRTQIWVAVTTVALAGGVIAGLAVHGAGRTSNGTVIVAQAANAKDAVTGAALKGLSDRLSQWLAEPGCEKPSFSIQPSDFGSEAAALKAGLKNAWNILKVKCSASSPGFPDFLYSIPAGTILRDPNSGHALLVTLQGWKSIPTGGDYLCFVAQGDPVVDLTGLDSVTMGFTAGDAKCTPSTPNTASSQPPISVVPSGGGALGQTANPQGPTVNPQPQPMPAPQPTSPQQPASKPIPAPPPTAAPTPPPPPTPQSYAETTGVAVHTWTNYTNAGGTEGPTIPSNATVQIACKLQGFRVQDGNTWWYRIASAPWNGSYYGSADAFYNNGQTSGSLHGTPYVDPSVPDC